MRLKFLTIPPKLTETVKLLNHQRTLLMRSLNGTLKKYVSVFSTLVKGIMMKDGLKKPLYVNAKNLKGSLDSLLTRIKLLKVRLIKTKKPF